MAFGGMRRHERTELSIPVQLMWKGRDGGERYANARALDISEIGMRLEVPEPLEERSYVLLRSDKLKLNGRASVRSCQRKGARYWVGLEFSRDMKWMPPQSSTGLPPE